MNPGRNSSAIPNDPLLSLEPSIDEEISVILRALLKTIDTPFRRSDPAPKAVVYDYFGTPKAGKTKTTEKIEQVFRRHKFNVFCPPETAEIAEIRNKSSDNPIIFQARHLTGDESYYLNLPFDRYHFVNLSRGLIDMLFWYGKGSRDGSYSATHHESVRNHIYELLRLDLVDAYVFFTCSVEVALEREYKESVTQIRGSKMTEEFLRETRDIYDAVLEDVKKHVPGLPIFHVDTSNVGVREAAQAVLRLTLPMLCQRFSVSAGRYLPHSISLIDKRARETENFEEQLKLQGHPAPEKIVGAGWIPLGTVRQEDTYLNPYPERKDSDGFFDEIIRLRREGESWKFIHKGKAEDRIFSHRRPLSVVVDPEDVESIRARYPTLLTLVKTRRRYERRENSSDGEVRFTIHLDSIDGLGDFTEIRAHGSSDSTHTEDLLRLAHELGFNLKDVAEGSYLALALRKK